MITGVKTKATIQENGITLIALVITIVILIILATVTMSFVFGEEGLIARAQQAAEMTEVQDIIEQMELAKAEVAMENGGKINVDDFFEKLEENEIIGSVENDVVDNGDGTYDIVTDDGYEFEVTVTPDGDIEIEYSGKGEGPRIRNINIEKASNSVTVTVETKNAEGGKFTYSYKKNSEGEESWQEAETNTSSNTCTIENLEANEIYNIKVKIETNKGTVERIINVQVGEMPVGKVNFSSYVWQGDGTANIVINTTEVGYTLQYQIVSAGGGMPDSSSWTDINSGETITGLVYGDTVYGRLWDGTNESDYGNATIDDDLPPQVATIDLSGTTTDTEGSTTATVTMQDNESGVDATGSKWIYNTTSTNIGTDETSYTNSFTTNPEEITLQETTAGTYYLHVLTKDKAGNKVETISDAINIVTIPGTVEEGKENGTSFPDTTTIPDDLGNNVVIPGDFHIAEGSGTKVEEGIVIEDNLGNQFVWIPTGEYRVSTTVSASGKLTNNLSRRTFTSTNSTEVDRDDDILDPEEPEIDDLIYRGEESNYSIAKDQIGAFKNSAKSVAEGGNGGFYIGRYEASTEIERTSNGNVITLPMVQANKFPYIYISRDQAKAQAEAMYSENKYVTSELMSSYAWDTALNFICQTNTARGYKLATSNRYGNIDTGNRVKTGTYTSDKYNNIHDFLGNCYEWTTEYCTHNNSPAVVRGGVYENDYYYPAHRLDASLNGNARTSFRIQLYIK